MEDIETQLITSSKYYFADYPEGIPLELMLKAQTTAKEKARNLVASQKTELTPFIFLVDFQNTSNPASQELTIFLDQIINQGLNLQTPNYQIITIEKFDPKIYNECSRLLVVFGAESLLRLSIKREFSKVRNLIIPRERFDLLITDSLSEIKNNPKIKKQFWEVLKKYA